MSKPGGLVSSPFWLCIALSDNTKDRKKKIGLSCGRKRWSTHTSAPQHLVFRYCAAHREECSAHGMGVCQDLACKRGSVGLSMGLLISRSSVRFRLKPENSNNHGLNFIDPQSRVLNYSRK